VLELCCIGENPWASTFKLRGKFYFWPEELLGTREEEELRSDDQE
jgi:hypothetical protein